MALALPMEQSKPLAFTTSQMAAIQSTGIKLVMAGPGSGKTAVVVEYIVHKLAAKCVVPGSTVAAKAMSVFQPPDAKQHETKVVVPGQAARFDPTQICAATFGRKACHEIKARLTERLDHAVASRVAVVTLHAMCKMIIEPFREWFGFDPAKPVGIVPMCQKAELLATATAEELAQLEQHGPVGEAQMLAQLDQIGIDRKSTRLNSSHSS